MPFGMRYKSHKVFEKSAAANFSQRGKGSISFMSSSLASPGPRKDFQLEFFGGEAIIVQ